MLKRSLFAAASLASLAALTVSWQLALAAEKRETTLTHQMHAPPAAVSALGRIEPASRVLEIAAPSGNEGATIQQLLVEEGDHVEVGTPLAILDNFERRSAAVRLAEAEQRAAEARLSQVRAGALKSDLEAKRQEVNQHQTAQGYQAQRLARAKLLVPKQSIAVEEYETRQWEYEQTRFQYGRAAAELESLATVRDVDVDLAQREVEAARAVVEQRSADLDASRVVAPIAGTVLRIERRPGERLDTTGLLQLAQTDRMQVVAEVYEADLPRVRLGQPAQARVASSGLALAGEVVEIGRIVARKGVLSNDPISDIDARVVEVRIDLTLEPDSPVRRLSNARVEVLIDTRQQPTETRP
jgi:HlyD family secretion protein